MFSNTTRTMSLIDKTQIGQNWDPALDPSVPAWKRELIMKKRAAIRTAVLGCSEPYDRPISPVSEAYKSRDKWFGNASAAHHSAVHPGRGYTELSAPGTKHKDWDASKLRPPRSRAESVGGSSRPIWRSELARAEDRLPVYKFLNRMGEEKKGNDTTNKEAEQQSLPSPSYSSYSDGFAYDYDSNSEEFEYGPGIVDRLRSKFISLTESEKKQQNLSLRRVASLEELLEKDGLDFGCTESKVKYATLGSWVGSPLKAKKMEILKKARSMETLTAIGQPTSPCRRKSNLEEKGLPSPRDLLFNEKVVIIEQPRLIQSNDHGGPIIIKRDSARRPGSTSIDEDELPKPDTVRTYKKIFETSVSKGTGRFASRIRTGAASKVANHKNSVAKLNNTSSAKFSWVDEAAASGLIKKRTEESISEAAKNELNSSVLQPLTIDVQSVSSPLVNGDHKKIERDELDKKPNENMETEGIKMISEDVIQHIREQSTVLHFFGPKKNNETSPDIPSSNKQEVENNKNSATINKPRIVDVKPKVDEKPIGLIKPITKPEQKENLINQAITAVAKKSLPVTGMNGTIESNASPEKLNVTLKKTSSPSEPSTMVFNFTKASGVTPNISDTKSSISVQRPVIRIDKTTGKLVNNLYKGSDSSAYVILPGVTATESSEFSDDDEISVNSEPIQPCGIVFEGENVIVGRSCFLEKRNKQLKIAFNDNATEMYEYPSEALLLEELGTGELSSPEFSSMKSPSPEPREETANSPTQEATESSSTSSSSLKSTPALSSLGGLASYIPSKLSGTDTFELGISRTVPAEPPPAPSPKQVSDSEDMFLKPADDNQASPWSSSQMAEPDILF